MDIQFLGATGTVTGSRYLFRSGWRQILVDCGLYQGYKQLRLRNWAPLPIDPGTLDAVLLTHAHIDHSGYLPLLVRNGFRGKIYCTRSTEDLCRVLLPDSAHLQEEEAEYANRKGFSKHKPALPLYTMQDARHCLKHFKSVDYDIPIDLGEGLTARLLPAGHLLGAAMVSLRGSHGSVLFSGDIGRPHDVLMKAPAPLQPHDYLVVESTYGNRIHPADDVAEKLADVVNRTAARGGIIIVPAFAVGRTQAMLYHLGKLRAQHRIPNIPVYVNSPMATEATRIYMDHPGEHRLNAAECKALCASAHFVQDIEESRALNEKKGPMVIIAGSGMATGGRVVHHLKSHVSNPANTVLFTGFQTGGTRGAAMVAGVSEIKIHGEYIPVRAEVAMLDNLSGHADADELLAWLKHCPTPPRTTFITHGEPAAADALRLRIEEELHWHCVVPDYLQDVKLN
jgi:metallo-beta-lactamase family protein